MFSEFSQGQLNESKTIPYAIAKDRTDKGGFFWIVTPVSWEGVEIIKEKVNLHTIGETEVIKKPELPRGYQMIDHDETLGLLLAIYDGRKTYSPEYVDKAKSDLEYLADNNYLDDLCLESCTIEVGDEEYVSFLQDTSHPNIIRYQEWLDNFSRQWLEAFVKAGFLVVSNHLGLWGEMVCCAEDIFEHSFEMDYYSDKEQPFADEFYENTFINPPRRNPTDNDVLSLNLGFKNIILSRLESHQNVLYYLDNQVK